MYPCPHCQKASFSDLQKIARLWFRPAVCHWCHKAAYLPVRSMMITLIVWTLLSWVFIGLTLYFNNVLFLLGTFPSAFLAVDICIRKAPLWKFEQH